MVYRMASDLLCGFAPRGGGLVSADTVVIRRRVYAPGGAQGYVKRLLPACRPGEGVAPRIGHRAREKASGGSDEIAGQARLTARREQLSEVADLDVRVARVAPA